MWHSNVKKQNKNKQKQKSI